MSKGQLIVSGGSRGIGAAIACELEARGFSVTSLSRSGRSAAGSGIACDVTDPEAVAEAVSRIARAGPLVGLVNNAGVHSDGPSLELGADEFQAMMLINAQSALYLSQAAYPHLERAGSSLIVNIGSFFDKLGVPGNLAYCASKAALGAITRCLAVEWAKAGIRVLNVAPGYVATDLNADFLASERVSAWLARRIPTGGASAPDQIGKFVACLFADNISFLTGETIYVDGGQGINH